MEFQLSTITANDLVNGSATATGDDLTGTGNTSVNSDKFGADDIFTFKSESYTIEAVM